MRYTVFQVVSHRTSALHFIAILIKSGIKSFLIIQKFLKFLIFMNHGGTINCVTWREFSMKLSVWESRVDTSGLAKLYSEKHIRHRDPYDIRIRRILWRYNYYSALIAQSWCKWDRWWYTRLFKVKSGIACITLSITVGLAWDSCRTVSVRARALIFDAKIPR